MREVRIGPGEPKLNVALARKTVRELRAKRGGRIEKRSRAELEKLLGYFGPPVKNGDKRRKSVKKGGRKRVQGRKVAKRRAA
jgi:hypothetical protein